MSLNLTVLHGNIGNNPEVKHLESGKVVAKFSLATTRRNKDKTTDWHTIIVWDKLAELCEKYLKKGSEIVIEGEIQYRNYEDKDGKKVYLTEIIAHQIDFAGGKKEEKPDDKQGQYQKGDKVKVEAMSKTSDLPGNVNDGSVPDDLSDMPF